MSGRPQRIQLRRTKGWRKPENTVVVSRPSKWGNPYYVGSWDPEYVDRHARSLRASDPGSHVETAARAVELYAVDIAHRQPDLSELRGMNLACWCPLEADDGTRMPCHADVLLELANGGKP